MSTDFIDSAIHSAVTMQMLYEEAGNRGYSDSALMYFAFALHTNTDNESPEHHGYQEWDINNLVGDAKHVRDEEHSSKSSDPDSEEARYQANLAAARLWGEFQSQLHAAETNRQKIGCPVNEKCPQ